MSVAPAPRLFDLASLLEVARCTSNKSLCRRLHVSGSAVSEARAGGLTERQADTWACRLGFHPGDVWPTWWLDIEDLDDDEELVLEEGALAA